MSWLRFLLEEISARILINKFIDALNAEKCGVEQRSKTAVSSTGKVSQNSIFTVTENKKTT